MIHALPGPRIPVVIMTARASETDQAAFLEAGARAVIKKPFAPLELAASLRRLLDD
jgi:DNA-binding response OmpR family regulator